MKIELENEDETKRIEREKLEDEKRKLDLINARRQKKTYILSVIAIIISGILAIIKLLETFNIIPNKE